jgi:dihydrofolate reductase
MIMGKIVVHEFMTLDGVIEAPTWTFDYPFDPKMGEAIGRIMGSSEALLLGRRTYEEFEPAWSSRTADEDPGAPFMNESPKYVASATLQSAEWNNSTILGPDGAERISALKDQIDGDIYVSGSGTLVRAMLADGLVNELHLFVFPLTLGAGERLFAEGGLAVKSRSRAQRRMRAGSCTWPTGRPSSGSLAHWPPAARRTRSCSPTGVGPSRPPRNRSVPAPGTPVTAAASRPDREPGAPAGSPAAVGAG